MINRIIFILLFFALNDSFLLNAQFNLVPNPSFEIYKSCPVSYGAVDSVPPWKGTNKDSDYFNECAEEINGISVPNTVAGFQRPRTGKGFVGQYFLNIYGANAREYIQVPLTHSLQSNHCYKTQFYINYPNSGFKYACNNIGAYFSLTSFTTPSLANSIAPYTPQIISHGNPKILDTLNWISIGGIYKAIGGEKFLTIGNFMNDSLTDTLTINPGEYGSAYYFIDDVSVQEISSPTWLHDTIVYLGDSVFIGSNFGGLNCKWYSMNGQQIDSIPGFYVKPAIDTKYIAHHTFCGSMYIDTIEVKINTNLVGLYDHSNSNRTDFYPQPVNDILFITNIKKEVGKQKVIVYDIFGKIIKEEEIFIEDGKVKLDVSLLENGYYLLQIKSNNKTRTDRFFVCH